MSRTPHRDPETQDAIDQAKKEIGPDYATILGFMEPPTPTRYRRTAPEIAYRAMGEAIEGLTTAELRELARMIGHWKKCNFYRRRIIENVASTLSIEQFHADQEREREVLLDLHHPVIDFQKARAAMA